MQIAGLLSVATFASMAMAASIKVNLFVTLSSRHMNAI
jgi:hypothetical protein